MKCLVFWNWAGKGLTPKRSRSNASIVAKKPAAMSHVDAAALRAHRADGAVLDRGFAETEIRRDDPDPGRRGRRRELCDPACQASRRPRHHHRQRRQSLLPARHRRRRGDRLQRNRLHQGRAQLRCGVRNRRRGRGDAIVCGSQARRTCRLHRVRAEGAGRRTARTSRRCGPIAGRDRAHLERVAALYEAGVIRKPEVKLYDLSQAAEAHRVSEGRHLRGKLVFKVR